MNPLAKRIICLIAFAGIFGYSGNSQLIYTRAFTDKIQKLGLNFYEPTENWLHLQPSKEDAYFQYDLILFSDDGELDIRFILQDVEDDPTILQFPHIEFTRTLVNLSTNKQEEDIVISQLPDSIVHDYFNADWALMADMIPKKEITNKKFGRAYAIFKEDRGFAVLIIFSNQSNIDQVFERMLSFAPN